jgi:hypothetical protein
LKRYILETNANGEVEEKDKLLLVEKFVELTDWVRDRPDGWAGGEQVARMILEQRGFPTIHGMYSISTGQWVGGINLTIGSNRKSDFPLVTTICGYSKSSQATPSWFQISRDMGTSNIRLRIG